MDHSNGFKNLSIQRKRFLNKTIFCLGNISKVLTANYLKKIRVNGHMHNFYVSYETIDISDVAVIHKNFSLSKHLLGCCF